MSKKEKGIKKLKKEKSAAQKLTELAEKEEQQQEPELDKKTASNIRERLLQRLRTQTVKVPFEDSSGTFYVEARLLSPNEQQQILQLQIELSRYRMQMTSAAKPEDKTYDEKRLLEEAEKGKELMKRFYDWVGEICVDPQLDGNYWNSGVGYSIDVPIKIMAEALKQSRTFRENVSSFRKK